ncbi:tyrosine-type recombinase/integrase [Microbacterium sp. NPDC089190]|uniref:tyrosine-type recombinase/integrase n=1 Tax=Microbacterium sp. NPDC089190 TaxID=3155063 RepID=UPI00344E0E0D
MARLTRGKGEGSIAFDQAKRLWVGRIELPAHDFDEHGVPKRRRRIIRRKDKSEVMREMQKLRKQLEDRGDLPTASQTTGTWLSYWLREIAPRERRPKTMVSYRSVMATHIIPVIGRVRLDKLTPADVRKVTARMASAGASSTSQRNAFSILSAALRTAEREGRIPRNPCDLMDAPRKAVAKLDVLTVDEARRLLNTLSGTLEGALWATYILTGARRGEVLGFRWDSIQFDGQPRIELSWQLQRLGWAHGCGEKPEKSDRWPCGFIRGHACHSRWLDVPADYEYEHLSNGMYLTRPKSKAGWRVIPLVEPLYSYLAWVKANTSSNEWGLVFTDADGGPIDPDKASKAWPLALKAAGINKPGVRLHDARHTAVDLLYAAKVPEDVIMRIVGHSTRAMSRSYASGVDDARDRDAMRSVSSVLGFGVLES